ncbi:hypothetical protein ACODYM_29200 [Burkholderia gladioli]|uniref:hypothetical protein n=1 Tax=Burkholderia gladioli TaxID=28095 RepID=UPI003B50F107
MTTIVDNADFKIQRTPAGGHRLSLLPRIHVEPGSRADWELLSELHYKAANLGIGEHYWRCVLDGQTIGVGVMTVPKMLSRGRNKVMPHMRPNQGGGRDTKLMNTYRAKWMNRTTCTNSRLVLDTMFRGAGIAYRMQNLMMRMTGCRQIEFQSSMSKFNPFARRAGVRFTPPERAASYKKGVEFFRRWFDAQPSDFTEIMRELDSMPAAVREKCIKEMRERYYAWSSMEKSGDNRMNGTKRVDGMAVPYLVKSLQQLTLASPLYGIYVNPDYERELPERIPLLAFDQQPIDQPLVLDFTNLK